MKKFFFSLIILLTPNFLVFSQTIVFDKGEIITNNGDTLKALVEFTPTYENVVRYRTTATAPIQKIRIEDLSSLKTPYNTFKYFPTYKQPVLFRESVKGKYSLLEFVKINTGPSYNAYGGTMVKYGRPTIVYAFESSSVVYFIKQKKDINQIRTFIDSCSEAKAIVDNKSFKIENLKEVIIKLNSCK